MGVCLGLDPTSKSYPHAIAQVLEQVSAWKLHATTIVLLCVGSQNSIDIMLAQRTESARILGGAWP